MLTTQSTLRSEHDLKPMKLLYERAFPENERRPFDDMMSSLNRRLEMCAFYEDNDFCGFAFLLNCGDISHIIYFAIMEEMRGRGLGSRALSDMCKMKAGKRVIVDIERDIASSPNIAQRRKRKQFYLRNGFKETPVRYEWRGEQYEILSCGGPLSEKDFWGFWDTLDKEMDVSEL